MGNTQGGNSDKNASEKHRKSSTVRGRVLARFKSRNNLPTKDIIVDRVTVTDCVNEFTNIACASPVHRTVNENVLETADIHSSEKTDKIISQISQGADSAKDALDFANQNQFDNESSNVAFEQIYDIEASARRASSTIPTTPPTLLLKKSFHSIPNELLHVSLTSTTTENTKTVTSSPADIHTGLNQTTTTQTKAAQQVIPEELWESTNVRTNNVFSNYLVLNDVAASNLTLIDDTNFGRDRWCDGDDSKINESECESNQYCNRKIIFSTRSWDIARKISNLFERRNSEIEITNNLTPSTTDIIVLREQTTSSSSDSIFTDPLTTPIGFATEINQCYYSEENVCDTSDVDKLAQLTREAIESRNYSRKTKSNLDILNKLSKLSITDVDCYYTTPRDDIDARPRDDSNVMAMCVEDELNKMSSSSSVKNKVSPLLSSASENSSDVMSIFNVARVKKVELHDLSPSKKVVGEDDVSATINEGQLIPTILQQQRISTSTPSSTVQQQLTSICSPTSQGDGNVLKMVASFTVERTNSDNTASKISRPSYVPEKLNFGAYEKFEGQMLLNWMSSSSQSSNSITDQDINQLIQQYCTNLLVAGVIKQISDKYAPIQDTFRPNLMYEWTHNFKSSFPWSPKNEKSRKQISHHVTSTPFCDRKSLDDSIVYNDLSTFQQKISDIENTVRKKIDVAKTKLHTFSPSMDILKDVFDDLDMICSELMTLQNNLSSTDILNETENELYVSCFNETFALMSDAKLADKNRLNETLVSGSSMLEDNKKIEDDDQNNCDKIEIKKNREKMIQVDTELDQPMIDKWTQTDLNMEKSNDVRIQKRGDEIEQAELRLKTIASIITPLSSIPSASLTASQNEVSLSVPPPPPPPPPPMPFPSSVPSDNASVSMPPPPPPPMPLSSMPPPPPPPMPSMLSGPQSMLPDFSSMQPGPSSNAPVPPPMPPSITDPVLMSGNIPSPQNSNGPPPPPPPSPLNLMSNSNNSSGPPPPPMLIIKSENDSVDAATSLSSNGLNGLVGPSSSKIFTPTPLPMPAAGNIWFQANTFRKNAVKPPKPMKPLYWTRIVAPPTITPQEPDAPVVTKESQLWQEIDETHLDNLDEFTELFSRPIIEPKKPKEEIQKPVKAKTIKVLDSKRSQSVGIFSRSLHVNFHEIEHAIYCCDTSVVSLEALQTLMSIKATPDELEMIKAVAEQDDAPLDPPEEFLLKISNFSCSAERISCIVFQSDFEEGSLSVTKKVNTVISLCEVLLDNEDLKTLFSIILTLGNYMNGGNRQRGQADGFGLEILGKLKDVKPKDSKMTLLHFIVKTYIDQCRKNGTPINDIVIPIPDPGDVAKAVVIDFKEIEDQVNSLQQKLNDCRKTTDFVIAKSTEDTLQPFKDQMNEFLDRATKRIEKLMKKLEDSKEIFMRTLKFYKFIPKSGPLTDVVPGQFFEYWASFTNDFRDIWKKEMVLLNNEIMKKARALYNKNITRVADRKVTPTKPGSLKERMLKLRHKNNQKLS